MSTADRVKQMAQEADCLDASGDIFICDADALTRFAQLVAEDCARVCDERYAECFEPEVKEMAQAIRARYSLKD